MLSYCVALSLVWIIQKPIDDLAFGKAQVEQVMNDRPEVGPVICSEPELRSFLEAGFAGFPTGFRVLWDREEPPNGAPGASCTPHYNQPAKLRLTTTKQPAIDKCVILVFELHNVRSASRKAALRRMVVGGSISREDYARSILHTEFLTELSTRDYLRSHPFKNHDTSESSYYNQFSNPIGDFPAYLKAVPAQKYDRLEWYRRQYDDIKSTWR